ncbi:MAG: U32 family peptidase, partial [Bacilli bacterium]
QICRWDFDLYDSNLEHLKGEKPFTFCSKDLAMLEVLPEMIDMGIDSFKIEGRMRSSYYIATVVNVYRKAIDAYCNNSKEFEYNNELKILLDNCANRESTVQFFNGNEGIDTQYYNGRIELSNQDFLGVVIAIDEQTMYATIEERNYFKVGDTVEIFGPDIKTITMTLDEIINDDGTVLTVVNHPLQQVKIKLPIVVKPLSMMRFKH